MAPSWPHVVPCWAKLASSWTQVGPKLAPSWHMLAQVGPCWAKLAPSWSQVGPKLAPSWHMLAQVGPSWCLHWPPFVPPAKVSTKALPLRVSFQSLWLFHSSASVWFVCAKVLPLVALFLSSCFLLVGLSCYLLLVHMHEGPLVYIYTYKPSTTQFTLLPT